MPNDVPDWTGLNQVNLVGGVSGKPLGDSAAATPAADSATLTVNANPGPINNGLALLLSLKAAAGSTVALRSNSAPVVGTAQSVTGANFAPATVAGNCLFALVSHGGTSPASTSPGWVKVADTGAAGAGECDIWIKPNCGNAEAAPTITCTNPGGTPMHMVTGELTGVATVTPQENTGTLAGPLAALTVVATAADAAFGDAVLAVARWQLGAAGTVSFSEVFNNGAVVTHLGGLETDSVAPRASDFALGIIPAATVPQPVGVEAWDYDQQPTSLPATGTNASIVLAAVAGKAYRVGHLSASLLSMTAATHVPSVSLIDGATTIWVATMGVQAAIGSSEAIEAPNVAHKGSINTALTFQFSGNAAGGQQGLALGVYLR